MSDSSIFTIIILITLVPCFSLVVLYFVRLDSPGKLKASLIDWEKIKSYLQKDSYRLYNAQKGDSLALLEVMCDLTEELSERSDKNVQLELNKFPMNIATASAKHSEEQERFVLLSQGYQWALVFGQTDDADKILYHLKKTPPPNSPMFITPIMKEATDFDDYILKLTNAAKKLQSEIESQKQEQEKKQEQILFTNNTPPTEEQENTGCKYRYAIIALFIAYISRFALAFVAILLANCASSSSQKIAIQNFMSVIGFLFFYFILTQSIQISRAAFAESKQRGNECTGKKILYFIFLIPAILLGILDLFRIFIYVPR